MSEQTRKCPHCAEEIQAAAKVCKHCQKSVRGGLGGTLLGCLGLMVLLLGGCTVLALIGRNSADHEAPSTSQPATEQASPVRAASHKIGEQFQVGHFSYLIQKPKVASHLGNSYTGKRADAGSHYIVVDYIVRNDGSETDTVLADKFQIKTPDGTTYSPDSEGTTALMMNGGKHEFLLSQLQPKVQKNGETVFEVPISYKLSDLTLYVPPSGLFSDDSAEVALK